MPRIAPLLLVVLAAGCGGDSSAVRRIAGGKEVQFAGVTFDVPATWSTQAGDGGMRLTPQGANASGTLEELYLLTGDRALRSLDGEQVESTILQVVEQLQPGPVKKSGPEPARFGALDGRQWVWSGRSQFDKDVEIRVFAFLGDHACALFAVGLPEVLARRDSDLAAILAPLGKPAAGAGGAAAVGARGANPEELTGQWIWLSNYSANSGGSQSNTWITLQADGRYQWHHDSVSSNPNGAAWGAQDEAGTWSLAGDQITFRPDGGAPYSQTLEKQNHPKNVNDPMIVLDGKAYVTATGRRPW